MIYRKRINLNLFSIMMLIVFFIASYNFIPFLAELIKNPLIPFGEPIIRKLAMIGFFIIGYSFIAGFMFFIFQIAFQRKLKPFEEKGVIFFLVMGATSCFLVLFFEEIKTLLISIICLLIAIIGGAIGESLYLEKGETKC